MTVCVFAIIICCLVVCHIENSFFLRSIIIYGLLCTKPKCNKGRSKATSLEKKASMENIFYCRLSGFDAGSCSVTIIAFNQLRYGIYLDKDLMS